MIGGPFINPILSSLDRKVLHWGQMATGFWENLLFVFAA